MKAAAVSASSTDEYLEGQVALSRLDGDGAPLGPQARLASTPDQGPPNRARLSLVPPSAGHRGLGGGWWPRSRDATAELPGLIAELRTATGRRVSRIALQADAFDNIPHLLMVGGSKVHVAWFRHMNPNTVLLTMADRHDLVLLVVPPLAPPGAAVRALRAVASGPGPGPADAILVAAGITCSLG
jgi:hypothetical protein